MALLRSTEQRLDISRDDLEWAASRGLIAEEQINELWNSLQLRHRNRPSFSSSHVSYHIGAVILSIGMAWLLGKAWSDEWGGAVVFLIASTYIGVFAYIGQFLWFRKNLTIPGGLLVTFAVCVTPIAVYGFQLMIGWWYRPPDKASYYDPFFDDHTLRELLNFLPMEIATLIAGSIALKFISFPFLITPMLLILWNMSIDWVGVIVGQPIWRAGDLALWVSFGFGVICIAVASWVERILEAQEEPILNKKKLIGCCFWLFTVGVFTFWWGLTFINIQSEWGRALRLLANIGLIVLSVLLKRFVFVIFGSIGILMYLFHLSELFSDWILFPFAITLLGASIFGLGLYRSNVNSEELTRALQEAEEDPLTVALNESDIAPEAQEATTNDGIDPEA